MSYNIRYDNPKDSPNSWQERKTDIVQLINYYQPTVLGIQEGLVHQVRYIDDHCPGYEYIGVGRDDGEEKGEFTAIFYNTARLKFLDDRTFWLSDNPEKVSVGWDASMERICTFGTFIDLENGDTIHVYNAHFDHIGKEARKKSAELIVSMIPNLHFKQQLIVMGDLNATPGSPPINTLNRSLQDSRLFSQLPAYGPDGTFNHFDPAFTPDRRIDYIFTNGLNIKSHRHIDDRRKDNLWVSDHLPVFIIIN